MILHLSALKFICQVFDQAIILFRSFWSDWRPLFLSTRFPIFVSSANFEILLIMSVSKSLIYTIRGRLIEVFKILNKFDNVDYKNFFRYNNNITRSNGKKLYNLRNRPSETEVAKNFFTNEVVEKWNDLPREVVNSISIDSFKKNLDTHFKNVQNQ